MKTEKFYSSKMSGEFLEYLSSVPETDGKLPLVIYIHGAGSRGDDINLLRENEALHWVYEFNKDKCAIVAPQCRWNYWFTAFELLTEFIDAQRNKENIDISRVYICGSSMGGYTTWQLCLSYPDWFAAAIPICGGGMYWAASMIKSLPIWAFHGAMDVTVLPEETVHMVKQINLSGGNAKITVFPKAGHNAWTPALSDPDTWEWLWEQQKKD